MWLMVVLKIPIGMLLYICWWAVRAEVPEPEAPPEDGGNDRRPGSPVCRGPRPRGPHGEAMPPAPPRTRTPAPARRVTAR